MCHAFIHQKCKHSFCSMKLLNSKALQRTLGKETHQNSFAEFFLSLSLFMLSFCHVHKQFRTGKNLKHLKHSRWRQTVTNSYWWDSCTLKYALSKAICLEVNWYLSLEEEPPYAVVPTFRECCPLGMDTMVRQWFWRWFGSQSTFGRPLEDTGQLIGQPNGRQGKKGNSFFLG